MLSGIREEEAKVKRSYGVYMVTISSTINESQIWSLRMPFHHARSTMQLSLPSRFWTKPSSKPAEQTIIYPSHSHWCVPPTPNKTPSTANRPSHARQHSHTIPPQPTQPNPNPSTKHTPSKSHRVRKVQETEPVVPALRIRCWHYSRARNRNFLSARMHRCKTNLSCLSLGVRGRVCVWSVRRSMLANWKRVCLPIPTKTK